MVRAAVRAGAAGDTQEEQARPAAAGAHRELHVDAVHVDHALALRAAQAALLLHPLRQGARRRQGARGQRVALPADRRQRAAPLGVPGQPGDGLAADQGVARPLRPRRAASLWRAAAGNGAAAGRLEAVVRLAGAAGLAASRRPRRDLHRLPEAPPAALLAARQ
eukprot:2069965-Prymnesium_polylepis.1